MATDNTDRFHKVELSIQEIKSHVKSTREIMDKYYQDDKESHAVLYGKLHKILDDLYGKDGLITNVQLMQEWIKAQKKFAWFVLSGIIGLVIAQVFTLFGGGSP